MLIEDEQDLVWLYSKRLKKNGYEVITYPMGESAIRTIQHYLPDIIILDIKLPGRSGIEVFKEMKETPAISSIPVIFLSAMHEEEDFCIQTLKAVGFIKKPCAATELVAIIETALTKTQQPL